MATYLGAMIDFDAEFDLSELDRALSVLEKQIPFATALALTWTAKDVEQALKDSLPQTFTIRSNYTERGIRITPAKKSNLAAEVGSLSPYMEAQVVGQTESDAPVPAEIRKTPETRITKGKWPGRTLRKRKAFKATIGGVKGIWQRKKKARFPVRLLWVFAETAKTAPRWEFRRLLDDAVAENLPKNVRRAIDRILRDALR